MTGLPPAGAGGESVRVIGELKPPKLLKQVDPVYPEVARKARVEGIVILEATTDVYGRVQSIKVLRSIPLLDQAAIDAVRQWEYEPMLIDGKPRSAVFTTTVRFTLDGKSKTEVGVTGARRWRNLGAASLAGPWGPGRSRSGSPPAAPNPSALRELIPFIPK